MSPEPSRPRWSLRRWAMLSSLVVVAVLLAAIVAVGVAVADLTRARTRLLDTIGPAVVATQQLGTALIDQETGVRGLVLSARGEFLEPYRDGRPRQDAAQVLIGNATADVPGLRAELDDLDRTVAAWRADYAEPAIAAAQAGGPGPSAELGKQRFDTIRGVLGRLQGTLEIARADARGDLNGAASRLATTCVITLGGLLLVVAAAVIAFSASVVRPLSRLTGHVRTVAGGDFGHQVAVSGPAELVSLGRDVDGMRLRILGELERAEERNAALDAAGENLRRSNTELEQFAYVASHDLQEPLRKVASFCQLLERRYSERLDDSAKQYIAFAVDGAKRMQVLINDLLAFSRVGRHTGKHVDVDSTELARQATANLADAIAAADAEVVLGELPTVHGEAALLTAVFQNLIGNAVKFRGPDRPRVEVGAEADGDRWLFSVTDNGLGIEEQFADRVFVIFQRLHGKDAYPGTGIGLAMCRKIVEFHGGTIWLDTGHTEGTRFRFTLPRTGGDDER
ncbi:ATP-binding protein [Actinokineospora sp. NBRC 105648]|uniref:sensor histidine kinase n=1 Tax=Actinokineospora sp. NBRC 105648 TaxID=3032206 RepID=UPI0024A235E1|nr:ATP-binding protein [Actinokineospora sp. NBRC 105648]GLZ41977.1 histidine kinase [Actinokineospora sp. NBRC 105648]